MKFSEIVDGLLEGRAYQSDTINGYSFISLDFKDGVPAEYGHIRQYEIVPAFVKYKQPTISIYFCWSGLGADDLKSEWKEADLKQLMDSASREFWPDTE